MVRKSNNACLNQFTEHQNSLFMDNATEVDVTFVAGTTGALGAHTILTVTGTVAMQLFAVCSTNLAGAGATIEVGSATTTTGMIAQTTATNIDANEIWHDNAPDSSIESTTILSTSLSQIKIVHEDIIYTVGTAAISGGVLKFIVRWAPISADGNVVLA